MPSDVNPAETPAPGRIMAAVTIEALSSSYYPAQKWDTLARLGIITMSYRPPSPEHDSISEAAARALRRSFIMLTYSNDPLWRYTMPPPQPFAEREDVFIMYSPACPSGSA